MLSKLAHVSKLGIKSTRTLVNYQRAEFTSLMERIPQKYNKYLRLGRYDRPIGYLLLYLPCTWGVALGLDPFSWIYFPAYSALFFVGSVSMRAAGCIVNDLWDQEIDKKVDRTRTRPLASGELTPKQAFGFLVPHLAAGLGVLAFLNWKAIAFSFAITPVAALYPLAKRYTNYPQFILGLAFNSGMLVAYAAVSGGIDLPAVLGYASGIAWTLIYDTIYAHQDKKDDLEIGVKSTALTWGDRTKRVTTILNCFSLASLTAAGYFADLSAFYYPLLVLSHLHMYKVVDNVDLDDPESCKNSFLALRYFGYFVLLSIVVGKTTKAEGEDLLDLIDEVGEDLTDDGDD